MYILTSTLTSNNRTLVQINEDSVVSCADMARNDPLVQKNTYNTKGLLL